MFTPHQMTWYEAVKVAGRATPDYVRHEVPACFWQAAQALNFNKSGSTSADKVNVFVPLVDGQFAFKKDDYIVFGIVLDEIPSGESSSLLTAKYRDCFKITKADKKKYGTVLDHWQLGGA
ncbi:MAG: DUF6751 family protein [Anaerolineaceae bacterium]